MNNEWKIKLIRENICESVKFIKTLLNPGGFMHFTLLLLDFLNNTLGVTLQIFISNVRISRGRRINCKASQINNLLIDNFPTLSNY
jgi:3-dehydroquinate dehydratase